MHISSIHNKDAQISERERGETEKERVREIERERFCMFLI